MCDLVGLGSYLEVVQVHRGVAPTRFYAYLLPQHTKPTIYTIQYLGTHLRKDSFRPQFRISVLQPCGGSHCIASGSFAMSQCTERVGTTLATLISFLFTTLG